jgi:nucleoside-diphosphate-sugar epimerase
VRVFVTGGSGFVGRYLLAALRERGDESVALARSDAAAAAVEAAGATTVVRGDLGDVEVMAAAMAGCEVVFHAAAVVNEWGDPEEFHRVNVGGTENVIAAARRAGVPRLVHVSTEAVLVGGGPIVRADETRPLPARPIGLYPTTKGLAERVAREADGDGLTCVIVRPRFVWGAGDTTLLPELVAAVKDGRFRWVSGGDHLTSTCHVRNLVEALLLAAERGPGGAVYFVTDGEPLPLRAFLTDLLATQGVTIPPRSIPRWLARALAWTVEGLWRLLRLRRRPPITRTAVKLIGEEVTVADDKARRDLGYRGHVTRAAGLAEMRGAAR